MSICRAGTFCLGVFSIADIAVFAYTHVSADAGISLDAFANVSRWIARVRAQPRFINDFVAYPANAVPDCEPFDL